jgi:prolipoprotein diacylglyceryltransferase
VIAWAVFFGLLHIYATRRGFARHIFSDIITFTLSIFFVSRLFFIIADWRTEGWLIKDLIQHGDIFGFLWQFFVTDNYSLSFAGGVIGFLIVFFWKTRKNKKERVRYWDVIMPAFLIAASIGYLGALFGGQIYGIVWDSVLSITYSNFDSIVPFQHPTFPLPILYAILSLLTVFALYRIEDRIQLPE